MEDHFLLFFPISTCLFLVGLMIKPSPYRWMLWPLIACLNGYCYFYTPPNSAPGDQGLRRCISILYVFVASDLILLTDVQRELRRVDQEEPISNSGFWARFKWGLKLFFGPRGVGWAHEPKLILSSHSQPTRLQFVISQLCWLGGCVLIHDVSSILMRADPFLAKHAPPFAEQPMRWRFWGVALFTISSTINVSIIHIATSIVIVGTGLSQPDMWPPFFGKWTDAYTVRRFWGRTWHQLLRRTLSSHGKYLTQRLLRLPPRNKWSRLIELYVAFFISGVIHLVPSDARPLQFFLSQAVVITFEEIVAALAARFGIRFANQAYKLLGYVWVYCWFVYSIAPLLDTMAVSGISEYGGMKFSLILGICRGEWFPGS